MNSFVSFSLFAIFIFSLSTIIIPDAHAQPFAIDDGPSCGKAGGSWIAPTHECSISFLQLNPDETLIIPSGTTVSDQGFINIDGQVIILRGGNLLNFGFIGTGGGVIDNNGTINNTLNGIINNGPGGNITNNFGGIINSSGTITNTSNGTIFNNGEITNNLGGTITNNAASNINNTGTITNNPGGTIVNNVNGFITDRFDGIITNNGGTINDTGTIDNYNGTINNNPGGTINNNYGGNIYNTSILNNHSGGTINNNYGGSIHNYDGIINNNSGGLITNNPGGTIDNRIHGIINNSGAITDRCGVYLGSIPIGIPVSFIPCTTQLTVIKKIINDNGGNLTLSGVTLKLDGNTVTNGTANTVPAGDHTISETVIPGYTATFGGDCDVTGKITLAPGDSKTCIITNNDNPPVITQLTIIKKIINDNGGNLTISGVTLKLDSSKVTNGTANTVPAGDHTISETVIPGYTATFGGDCDVTGKITLAPGDSKTCIITNDDNPVASLTIIKKIINDNGGNLTLSGVTLKLDGNTVTNGTANTVPAGDHTISETVIPGYTATFGGDCDVTGKITLAPGDSKTCIITNNDNPPVITQLTIIKKIINDNGGNLTISGVTLKLDGSKVTNGTANTVSSGNHTVSETVIPGYTATFVGDCDVTGKITLASGDNKTCIILNNDNPATFSVSLGDKSGKPPAFDPIIYLSIYNATTGYPLDFFDISGNQSATLPFTLGAGGKVTVRADLSQLDGPVIKQNYTLAIGNNNEILELNGTFSNLNLNVQDENGKQITQFPIQLSDPKSGKIINYLFPNASGIFPPYSLFSTNKVTASLSDYSYIFQSVSQNITLSSGTNFATLQTSHIPTLRLKITDGNGNPVPGIFVGLTDAKTGYLLNGFVTDTEGLTSESTLYSNTIGDKVNVTIPDVGTLQLLSHTSKIITLTGMHQNVTIPIQNLPAGNLAGHVTFPDGSPASNLQVTSTQHIDGRDFTNIATTDSGGHYDMALLAGNATITTSSPSVLYSPGGKSVFINTGGTNNLDFALKRLQNGFVSAVLFSKVIGNPEQGPLPIDWRVAVDFGMSVTDALGNSYSGYSLFNNYPVLIHGVPGDKVNVCFNPVISVFDSPFGNACQTVTLDANTNATATIHLSEAGQVKGRVVDAGTAQPANSWFADLYSVNATGFRTWIQYLSNSTATLGYFIQQGGSYQLDVTASVNGSSGNSPQQEFGHVAFNATQGDLTDIGDIQTTSKGLFSGKPGNVMTAAPIETAPGGSVNYRVQYSYTDTQPSSGTIKNATLLLEIPSGTSLVNGSLTLNGSKAADPPPPGSFYHLELGNLANGSNGIVTYQVILNKNLSNLTGLHASTRMVYDLVTPSLLTQHKEEIIGAIHVIVSQVSIDVPTTLATLNTTVSGYAPSGSPVKVYDGSDFLGQGVASQAGLWSKKVTLPDTGSPSIHVLRSQVQSGNTTLISNEVPVMYDPSQVILLKACMKQSDGRAFCFDPSQGIARFPYIVIPGNAILFDLYFNHPQSATDVMVIIGGSGGDVANATLGDDNVYHAEIIAGTSGLGPVGIHFNQQPFIGGNGSAPAPVTDAELSAYSQIADNKTTITIINQTGLSFEANMTLHNGSNATESFKITPDVKYRPSLLEVQDYNKTGVPIFNYTSTVQLNDSGVVMETSYFMPYKSLPPDVVKSIDPPPPITEKFDSFGTYVHVKSSYLQPLPGIAGKIVSPIETVAGFLPLGGTALTLTKRVAYLLNIEDCLLESHFDSEIYKKIFPDPTYQPELPHMLEAVNDLKIKTALFGIVGVALDAVPARALKIDGIESTTINSLVRSVVTEGGQEVYENGAKSVLTRGAAYLAEDASKVINAKNKIDALGKSGAVQFADKVVRGEIAKRVPNPSTYAKILKFADLDGQIEALANQCLPWCPGLRANPNWGYDPSGYVYEGISGNRLENVTATIIEQDKPNGSWAVWDATSFGEINPQTTDSQGKYAWDVPEANWQVIYDKPGYHEARSQIYHVPPPATGVNIGMVSLSPSAVNEIVALLSKSGTNSSINIEFSQYVKASTLSNNTIFVSGLSGKVIPFDAQPDPNGTLLTRQGIFVPSQELKSGQSYTVHVEHNIVNYAGFPLAKDYVKNVIPVNQASLLYGVSLKMQNNINPASITLGQSLKANSMTNDTIASKTKFVWLGPDNLPRIKEIVDAVSGAASSHPFTPTQTGTWQVDAQFMDGNNVFQTKSEKINVNPIILQNGSGVINPGSGSLTVIKKIINDNGGHLTISGVTLKIDGQNVTNGTVNAESAGDYAVNEIPVPGYNATFGRDCDNAGLVTVTNGTSKVCIITNNDNPVPATLSISSATNNGSVAFSTNSGGFSSLSAVNQSSLSPSPPAGSYPFGFFSFVITGVPVGGTVTLTINFPSDPGSAYEKLVSANWNAIPIKTKIHNLNGTYTVILTLKDGAAGQDSDGEANGVITDPGGIGTLGQSSLSVIKKIINDNGGNLTISGVTLKIDGQNVTNGTANLESSGNYTVSEIPVPGYTGTFSGDCDNAGHVRVTNGSSKVCTITNNDNPMESHTPEAFNQFDPVTKNVLVFERNTVSGNSTSPVSPISVIPYKGHSKLLTYHFSDISGNSITLVEQFKKLSHHIAVHVLSVQYNSGPVIKFGENKKQFNWKLNKNGTIKKLNQEMEIGHHGDSYDVKAHFDSKNGKTTITVKSPKTKTNFTGMILLRMATNNGNLAIEFP